MSSGFDAGGAWAVQFGDQHKMIKCYAVVSGGCWLSVEGVDDPVWLGGGDCFVLPTGRPFRLGSNLDGPAVPAADIFPPARRGGVVTIGDGDGLSLVGSRFGVSGSQAEMLLSFLPPIIHIREQPAQEALRWCVKQMMYELRNGEPGNALAVRHLAHLMLVQALRVPLSAADGDRRGWFFALADRQLGAALMAIHDDPARPWTLQALGAIAGMSRSTFAVRFKEQLGQPAMHYLARWRMLLACERLEQTNDPVAAVATSLGYESESAFSTAFKRLIGCAPRQFGRAAKEEHPSPPQRSPFLSPIGSMPADQTAM
ncbi:AraC-like DNA-binding protein [Sphingomonas zeicaulis]